MKGLENELYRVLLLISVIISSVILITAIKWPRIARLLFFFLFAWASFINWKICSENPRAYLEYGVYSWSSFYRDFINGWFSEHIKLVVGFIATCQAMISISMLLGGKVFRVGAVGAIVFLLAIIPFGVGSGFPSTLIMAIALFIILKKNCELAIWKHFKPTNQTVHSTP